MRTRNQNGLTYVDGLGYEGVIYAYTNKADNDKKYIGIEIWRSVKLKNVGRRPFVIIPFKCTKSVATCTIV